MSRTVAIPSHGRFVAIRRQEHVAIVDAYGTAPERRIPWDGHDLAFGGDCLWLLEDGGLRYVSPVDLSATGTVAVEGMELIGGSGPDPVAAVIGGGGRWWLVTLGKTELVVDELPPDQLLRPLVVHDQRILVAGDGRVAMVKGNGDIIWQTGIGEGSVLGGAVLFDGRAVAVHVRSDSGDVLVVLRSGGERLHVIPVPTSDVVAFAAERGIAILHAQGELHRVELRWGRKHGVSPSPLAAVQQLLLDDDGRFLVAAGPSGTRSRPQVLHIPVSELFPPPSAHVAPKREPGGPEGADEESERESGAVAARNGARSIVPVPVAVDPVDAGPSGPMAETLAAHDALGLHADLAADESVQAPDAAEGDLAEPSPPAVTIPELLPLALGRPRPPVTGQSLVAREDIFVAPGQHLEALLDLILARTGLAIASAWNSGRLSGRGDDARPFEREVDALLGGMGEGGGFAPERLALARQRLEELTAQIGGRMRRSIEAGVRLPFVDLTQEFDLSPVAAVILVTVMGPALRGEIARLYGVLANDQNRPPCDRYLVEQIVAAGSSEMRDQVARELSTAGSLVRYGLVRIGRPDNAALFAPITVDEALIERVRGDDARPGGLADVGSHRTATVQLDQLHVSRAVVRDLVLALSQPSAPGAPLRLVLRGRRGSGRHTIVAALAQRVGRDVVAIDCSRLPRAPGEHAHALRSELFRALTRDVIPVLSGLEVLDPADGQVRNDVRQVLRMHPGPLVVRTSPEAAVPLDPGYLNFALPALGEGERVAVWQEALARHELGGEDAERLAARYRLGPGEVDKVVRHVARRGAPGGDGDLPRAVDEAARQHVSARLDHVATRVHRLAGWAELVLPEDMLDSLREFVGRARHRRTVYERWGYDKLMTTSRGLTALFYGSPGTGKSMVAGVIAGELGLDLYRVDLARVVSKWMGETEKNLAEVFDAAEDGQVLILFDEADALFARRTDVRTANDRHACPASVGT